MTTDADAPTLELLLADARRRRPTLAAGLPEEAAEGAPRPEKTPRGVDALLLDAPFADPNDLPKQRWTVIAARGPAGDEALAAIAPLIALREEEQGAKVIPLRVDADMDLATAARWKNEVLHAEDVPQAERPRYLLILGDLHEVSAELQHVLANGAFVGRVGFTTPEGEPDHEAYARYGAKVVRWARGPAAANGPDALFFVADDETRATKLGRRLLVDPCVTMAKKARDRGQFPIERDPSVIDGVTGVADFLAKAGDTSRPSVLLTVSHGLGRPGEGWRDVAEQHRRQGALVVCDEANPENELSAEEMRNARFLPGGLWFCLACFGAGTPAKSSFHTWLSQLAATGAYAASALALVMASLPRAGERPFLAAMPQAALAGDQGPLAMIAHLDLAWTFGFVDPDRMNQSRASRIFSSLWAMVEGSRAGVAHDALMRQYREVNDELVGGYQLEADALVWKRPYEVDRRKRGSAFMLRNDLRGYVLLGDPAARLPLAGAAAADAPVARPSLADVFGFTPASSPSQAGRDPAEMEKAVLEMIGGVASPKAIAMRHGITREQLDRWEQEYKAAGRERLAKLR